MKILFWCNIIAAVLLLCGLAITGQAYFKLKENAEFARFGELATHQIIVCVQASTDSTEDIQRCLRAKNATEKHFDENREAGEKAVLYFRSEDRLGSYRGFFGK